MHLARLLGLLFSSNAQMRLCSRSGPESWEKALAMSKYGVLSRSTAASNAVTICFELASANSASLVRTKSLIPTGCAVGAAARPGCVAVVSHHSHLKSCSRVQRCKDLTVTRNGSCRKPCWITTSLWTIPGTWAVPYVLLGVPYGGGN